MSYVVVCAVSVVVCCRVFAVCFVVFVAFAVHSTLDCNLAMHQLNVKIRQCNSKLPRALFRLRISDT